MSQENLLILKEGLQELQQASEWLAHSYSLCKDITISREMPIESLDKLEALTSRFARLTDLLVSKVFRSIDILELEYGGSLIDVVNRAAKRGIVDSVEKVRDLKDLRNQIAHEYAKTDLSRIFQESLLKSSYLLDLCAKTAHYCKRF